MRDRRDEERKYQGDVAYDVWRSNGNPYLVDLDRVHDRFWDGYSADETAASELRRQRPERKAEPEDQTPEDSDD